MVAEAETVSTENKQNSDFILDTPITWTMVEMDMQKALNTTAKFGENKKAELIGQGNGFISKIVVATLEWDQIREELPEPVILKVTMLAKLSLPFMEGNYILKHVRKLFTLLSIHELMAQALDGAQENVGNTISIHNNELAFYRLVNGEWKVDHKDLRLPVFYCGREWGVEGVDAGYIALEHVTDGVMRHIYETVQSPGVIESLEAVAKLHALSLKHYASIEKFNQKFLLDLIGDMYRQDKMRANLPKVAKLLPECQEQIDIILEKLPIITLEGYQRICKETCQPPVLCHGDLWTANMLWTKNDDGNDHLRALIDWQMVHKGSPVEDIARFLRGATSWETKKRDLHLYFDKYYDAFVTECGEVVKPTFTKEQLIENYEKFLPFVTIPFAGFFLPVVEIVLASAPDKDVARAVFFDKMRGMLHEAADYLKKWY